MKIRVLGAFGGEGLGHRPSAFLINDKILIDGGSVSGALTVPEQLAVEHAIVSHAHLDHIAGLVYLTETLAFCELGAAVPIPSIDPVIGALRAGVFNNALWPDFSKIPRPDVPVVKYRALIEDVEQRVGDLWVTPVAVNHTVPTAGFIVHDGSTGVVYSGDTGPTEALWQAARGLRGLRAVIVEFAFPDRRRPRVHPRAGPHLLDLVSARASWGGGHHHDGFARHFDAHPVAEAKHASLAHCRQLDAQRHTGADVDLVQVAGALEDAQRDASGDARTPGHCRLGHRERLRPQDQQPTVAQPVGDAADDGHAVAPLRLDDDAEVANLDHVHREKARRSERLGDGPALRLVVELGRLAHLQHATAVDDREPVGERQR